MLWLTSNTKAIKCVKEKTIQCTNKLGHQNTSFDNLKKTLVLFFQRHYNQWHCLDWMWCNETLKVNWCPLYFKRTPGACATSDNSTNGLFRAVLVWCRHVVSLQYIIASKYHTIKYDQIRGVSEWLLWTLTIPYFSQQNAKRPEEFRHVLWFAVEVKRPFRVDNKATNKTKHDKR